MITPCLNRQADGLAPCQQPVEGMTVTHTCCRAADHDGLHACRCGRAWYTPWDRNARRVYTVRVTSGLL